MTKQEASQALLNAFGLITGPNVRGWNANEYEQAKALLARVSEWINSQPDQNPGTNK